MAEQNRLTMCSIDGKQFPLWTNPDASDLKKAPELVRFTVDSTCGKVYVWDYTCAMHTDMSMYLRLNDPYSSPNFLKGASKRGPDRKYHMVESHFLQAFKRSHLTNEERNILKNLLEKDWTWVDPFMGVTEWLESYRKAMGL